MGCGAARYLLWEARAQYLVFVESYGAVLGVLWRVMAQYLVLLRDVTLLEYLVQCLGRIAMVSGGSLPSPFFSRDRWGGGGGVTVF